ncbi:hypothetical protein ACMGDH_15305 [Sphingomonas sp. DT-207]|uniref:hypothetical protein n=1 Tax=Sphingomonas sp. DT-207 TaxID=3396167 RepID=UPI003F1A983B
MLTSTAGPAWAQDTSTATKATEQVGPVDPNPAAQADAEEKPKQSFFRQFFDEEDGKFDFSNILAKGGFLPMPVIITEPAVEGGFGIVAQFITMPKDDPRRITRRMVGAMKTGNGSYGYGYFQSGHAFDGKLNYKFGVGRGKITLKAFPSFAPAGIEYTNHYDYGIIGSAFWRLADERFSIGPIIDFRQLSSELDIEGLPDDFARDFDRKMNTGALGAGFHFDNRDNAMTPTEGVNAYVEAKFNRGAFGSDRDFEVYDLDLYAFHKASSRWRMGIKMEIDAARGRFPSYFAPAIDLRGVEAQHYQGMDVFSSEIEVTHQLSDRWALLGFAGLGFAEQGSRRLFHDSGAIVAGGGGFRYRIARKLGLDAGVDVAVGPGGAVFYLQFGHAWSMGMD